MSSPDSEIRRLIEIMPASGRMTAKLVSAPDQKTAIWAEFPKPWKKARPITINFDLWGQLSPPQRDLILLRTVSWLTAHKLFKPELYQGLVAAGGFGLLVELFQGDAIGVVAAGGLAVVAGGQIWRSSRSPKVELEADEAAIRVAQRRGYSESDAARHLFSGIETIARIEGRPSMSFTELMRCQNLKAIAGLSATSVPKTLRTD